MIVLAWLGVKTGTGNSTGLEGARGCCGGWLVWAEVVCRSTHVKVISWRQRNNDIHSVKALKGRPVACETLLVWYNMTCLPPCRSTMMVSWYQYISLLGSILFLRFFFLTWTMFWRLYWIFDKSASWFFFYVLIFLGGWATRHVGS